MEKLRETRNEARNRYDTAIDALEEKGVQVSADSVALPREAGSPALGFRYLLEECRAYDNAKGDFKLRKTLRAQIMDVVDTVTDAIEKAKGIVRPDNSVLGEFESIKDPNHASAFYREHQEVITAQLQARMNAADPKPQPNHIMPRTKTETKSSKAETPFSDKTPWPWNSPPLCGRGLRVSDAKA